MARLLLLVPTTSYRIGDFLAAAGRLGVEVAVGSNRRQVLERYSDGRTVTLNFRRPDKALRQIVDYAGRYPLAAIVGIDEETTVLAARAAQALGLAHNAPGSVAASANKHHFRTMLAEAGLPSPGFALVARAEDTAAAARGIRYPSVLKPLTLAASRGVIRVDDPAGFVAAFRRIGAILDGLNDELGAAESDHILVEDYIPGVEVALEGLLVGGRLNVLAMFDKPDPLEGPYFEETIYVTPSRLAAVDQAAVVAATGAAITAVGLSEGPVHAELRLGPDGPVVIELAARSIGGLCARTLRFGTGIGLEDLILRHALGLSLPTLSRERQPAGVMMIPIPKAGQLAAVHGLERARAMRGIEDVTITIPLGQRLVPLPEGNRYLGFLFARAATPKAVEAALRRAHSALDFEIEELGGGSRSTLGASHQ